jgi:ubiquinone/menaquinone biosynthesis C-methylase UbiE
MNKRTVLNVGGNSKDIPIPKHYQTFEHLLLDIDPKGNPDVLCDARELIQREGNEFDAVYCSHNLEHYYLHDSKKVLQGFWHVLKPGGMVEIKVPDLIAVMRAVVEQSVGLHDALYTSAAGPIMPLDVIYGWQKKIETSGQGFFAHKTGFTAQSLRAALFAVGFPRVVGVKTNAMYELHVLAFKGVPDPFFMDALKLPPELATLPAPKKTTVT